MVGQTLQKILKKERSIFLFSYFCCVLVELAIKTYYFLLMQGKTLILGATDNPERYAYKAAEQLQNHGFEFVGVGLKPVMLLGQEVHTDRQTILEDIDTITLYVGPRNQPEWYDYILKTKPRRLLFNPGTENEELRLMAENSGIFCQEACTLVLLSLSAYDEV